MSLLLQNAALPGRAGLCDILLEDGRIARMAPGLSAPGADRRELAGRVACPAFCDIHTHLDKAYTLELLPPNQSGTLNEAIGAFLRAADGFDEENYRRRARRLLNAALLNGTLHLRSHVTVAPGIGLRAVRALAALKREYAPLMDVQLVAMPQEEPDGMSPQVRRLMLQALKEGADLVGGAPSLYRDERRAVDDLFAIAKQAGRDLDLHVDEKDEARVDALEYCADKTVAEGFEGRVTVGHACALAAVDEAAARRVIGKLRGAGVTVATLPSCNLYLMGRQDKGLVRRGLTRVRELLDAGVNVAVASDNVRDPFRPFGNADMLEEALLAAQLTRMDTPSLLTRAWEMVTRNPARAMKLEGFGLAEGCRADLVVLDAPDIPTALLNQSEKLLVVRQGRIIVEKQCTVKAAF